MIVFVSTEQHRYTNRDLAKEPGSRVRIATYDELFTFEQLPRAAYVFTDLDRLSDERLEHASKSFRMLRKNGLPVYNDPSRFLGRYGVLRRLHHEGINEFNAYRVDSLEKPARWPVFIRADGDHKRPLSDLLHNQEELDAGIARVIGEGAPISTLLIIEYAAEEVRPGLFRKLSVFRIGEQMVGFICVHDNQWLVKYGKPNIATADMYDDEFRMVRDNPYGEEMRRIFQLIGLEYGRVDFGIVNGRPQIYEINSNPDVKLNPKSFGNEQRDRSNALFKEKYLAAVDTLDRDLKTANESGS